ncbi:MAG: hypothetical protein ACQXXG_08995 [Candidatus Bathyarchaeia archaeon]
MLVRKAVIVKPQKRDDYDLGDVIALARSIGKQVLKTKENIRVIWTCESPYGYVVIVEGCGQPSGCKVEEKDHE